MTKAELEAELEQANTQLFQLNALIDTMTEDLEAAWAKLEFTEGMLDMVDRKYPIFYQDWRGYRDRSIS